jgi:hypothetical protein
MTQVYSDPTRENDAHALPDVEVFHVGITDDHGTDGLLLGWYWWSCFPGCLPDGDASGPFNTEAEAIADAQAE